MEREFAGKNWLAWLRPVDVRYIVRLKKNALFDYHRASRLCERERWKRLAQGIVKVFGQQIRFAARRIKKRAQSLAGGHLKKKSYQFEDTHMNKAWRISKLMAELTVAYVLYYAGASGWRKPGEATVNKNDYPPKSPLRWGLESLHVRSDKPRRFARKIEEFFEVIPRKPLSENFFV